MQKSIMGGLLAVVVLTLSGSEINPLIWDGKALRAARQQYQAGASDYVTMVRELALAADRALQVAPPSVLDKRLVAPTGNKQDFFAPSIYWWPNPKTADGLPYIPRDGFVNPEIGNDATDMPAVNKLHANVPVLALAYFYTGERKYAQHAAAFLRTWFVDPKTRMNPNCQYGDFKKGHDNSDNSFGIINFSSRMHLTLDAVELIRASGAWSDADEAGLREWMRRYRTWLLESKSGRKARLVPNNHGTYFASQLAMIELYLGETAVARATIEEAFERLFANQFEVDGSQPRELRRSRSFDYAVMNLRGWLNLAVMGSRAGIDLWQRKTASGAGLEAGTRFFLPYVGTPAKPWKYRQIRKINWMALQEPMARGNRHYTEPAFRQALDFLQKNRPAGALEMLYFPAMRD